jgi:hypothetical protein
MSGPNTRFEYLYRDASNYRFCHTVVISGELQHAMIVPHLFDGLWFIPDRIGLPSLVPPATNEDDHLLHEVIALTPTSQEASSVDAAALLSAIRDNGRNGWFA